MAESNPYAAPETDLSDEGESFDGDFELANRWVRLGALILDGLILSIPCAVVSLVILIGILDIKIYQPKVRTILENLQISAVYSSVYAIMYFVFNCYLLIKNGQTIGKMICKIRIVKNDGSLPSLFDTYFKRFFLVLFIQNIPLIGILFSIIDFLLIFRDNHKCLHDEIAGTMVISTKKRRARKNRSQDDDEDDEYEDDEDDDEEENDEENDGVMRMVLPVGRSGWAIASGYLALFSVLILPAPFALITGILGVVEIRRNPKKGGMGRAIFGIIMGALGTAIILFFLGLFALEKFR